MLLGGTHPFWIWTWSYKLDMYNGVFTIGLWGSYHQPVNIQVWMLLHVFFCFFLQLIKEPGMITYAIVWFFYSDCSCNNLTLFKLGPIYVVIVDTYSWYLFPSLEMPLQGWVTSILLPIFIVYKCAWYSLKDFCQFLPSLSEVELLYLLQDKLMWHSRPISQIPECTCSISHNARFRKEMWTFLFWMEHCGIRNRCILGFVNEVLFPAPHG